jgi:PTS system mannose-specific IIB component
MLKGGRSLITLFRVDDRLIHGQVQTKWLSSAGVNKVVIVDDKTSKDPIALQILKIAAPNNISVEVYNESDGAVKISEEESSTNKVAVLFKSTVTVKTMIERGVKLNVLIIGPCSAKQNAKMVSKNTYFLREEVDAAKFIHENNVKIYFQLVPEDAKIDWAVVSKRII